LATGLDGNGPWGVTGQATHFRPWGCLLIKLFDLLQPLHELIMTTKILDGFSKFFSNTSVTYCFKNIYLLKWLAIPLLPKGEVF
jgi:hypothetical protein